MTYYNFTVAFFPNKCYKKNYQDFLLLVVVVFF